MPRTKYFLLLSLILLSVVASACGSPSVRSLEGIDPAAIAQVGKGNPDNIGPGAYVWVRGLWKSELQTNTLSELGVTDSFGDIVHLDELQDKIHIFVIATDQTGNPVNEVEIFSPYTLDVQGDPKWNIHFRISYNNEDVCITEERSITLTTSLGIDPALYCR